MIELFTTGYPKSGSTWLLLLLSTILDSPLQALGPQATLSKEFCKTGRGGYIIRKTHWTIDTAPAPPPAKLVFIQRDPRDVAISAMYYRSVKPTKEGVSSTLGTMAPYENWVRGWLETDVIKARYEKLHEDPISHLQEIIHQLTGNTVPPDIVENSIWHNRIAHHHTRDAHFFRKGIVGDWKNHFDRSHGEYMDRLLGEFMLEQGYIEDRNWWKSIPK